ncbi:MAG: hypothetical protein Q9227_006739 [Pyrenula ochraceoflavens]
MAVPRRGGNRLITFVLGSIIAVGVLFFVFSSSSTSQADSLARQRIHESAAENILSPPTHAFRKQSPSKNGRPAPPPVMQYQLNNMTSSAKSVENRERVLILTPLARFYQEWWDNLVKFTYPHDLISIGFIIPKNKDGDTATSDLQSAIQDTQSGPESLRFASISILRQDFDPPLVSQEEKERHKMENQKVRRASMSRARNSLLFTTIGPSTSWVLWLDADIIETPPSLIEDLTSHDKPVIVPNCYQRYINKDKNPDVRPYDFNSWVDSETAHQIADKMGPDDVLLEGYAEMATYRSLMAHMADKWDGKDPKKEMKLDGVGGTALLVKADVHRDGAMFPPFAFYHLLETEGFAKMARRLGYECWGLPNYFVYHYNEE